jgi:glutamine amidotransferase
MSAPEVCVLDYGSGNLRSAERALIRAGARVVVTGDLAVARSADGLVVPGVGAFAACMRGVRALGGGAGAGPVVLERLAGGLPVLGICVGMQIMFDRGAEHGVATEGIGALPGEVVRLRAPRIPHMGWNTVTTAAGSQSFAGSPLFDGIGPAERFYFVHSYAVTDLGPLPDEALVTTAEHGERFVAALEYGALTTTQFHPEKSGDSGARILANWVRGLS